MKRYQSYKPSSIEWIGEIPINWNETRLKYIGNLYGGLTGKSGDDFQQEDNPKNKPYIPYTNIFRNTYISKSHVDYVVLEEGENQNKVQKFDLFFLMSSETYQDLGKPCILIDDIEELYLNSFCKGFRVNRKDINPLFLNYQLLGSVHKELISIEGRGFTRINLRQDRLNETPIFVPPIQEQHQIVQYLDEKTDLIDKLISTKERKITLLKEQRTSLINQIITKGLNPNVKKKDSGVEWIGEIPIHWNLIKMKHKGDVIIGLSYSPEDIVDEGEGILVMRSSNVQEGKPSFLDNVYVSSKIPNKLLLKKGDILICSRNGSRRLIGKNCMITENEEGMTFGVFMTIYRSNYSRFMYWLLNSPIFESQSGLFLTSTINQLTVSTLQNMILPFVEDEEEQNQIVSFLDSKTKEIDDMISLEQRKIETLKEYRQSLISEVVTGKIKVTTD